MEKWIEEKRYFLIGSILVGLIVGFSMNFYKLSYPILLAQEKSETFYPIIKRDTVEDASYWRGRVDSKLESIDKKMDEFCIQIEKLNTHLTEVRVTAAKDGSIYGGVTSIIVLLISLIGQGIFRTWKNGKQ